MPPAAAAHLAPLESNIRLLGDVLGAVIAESEGRAFFNKVEHLRELGQLGRSRAAGHAKAAGRMAALITAASPAERYKIAKAFTELMQLMNVAEQAHRIRRRRHYRAAGNAPQKSSPDDMFARLIARGVSPARIKKALRDLNLELVITAHPTEVMMPETIRAYRDIAATLLALDNPALAEEERTALLADLRALVLRQWQARSLRDERPTPQDEARYGIELTEKILWTAVPLFFRQLRAAYNRKIGSMADLFPCPIRFASWMGGDRDGHPGVTAAVTREVLDMSIAHARRLYDREIDTLSAKLTFAPESAADRRLQAAFARHIDTLRRNLADGTTRPQFMARLESLKTLLQRHNLLPLVEKELQNLIWRVRVFGLSLLKLDLRQDAAVHARAVASLLPGYLEKDEAGRLKSLAAALGKKRIALPRRLPAETREVLATFGVLRDYPAELFGNYIISMATQASDLLAVQLLLKAAGVKAHIPICPLFETPDALAGAADVMRAAYAVPVYRRYAGRQQDIMVGYSDSGKRGGYFQSLWQIYCLQEDLTRIGRRHGIETAFFHGRGGAIARGGGPIESVLAMMPRPLATHRLRITEQGEIINSKFGMPGIAGRTMERYLSGLMSAIFARKTALPRDWRQMMTRLSDASAADFRHAIYEDPHFLAHFQQLTPAREMSLMKIGSRPGSRKKNGGLESMRAIPWIFSWTQPRVMLPAWKGVAAALSAEIDHGHFKTLRAMYKGWPFFRALIDMVEMSTALADEKVTEYYSRLLVKKDLQARTDDYMAELHMARRLVATVKGLRRPLQENPVLAHGIAVRTPYVDVLNILQAQVLADYRAGHHARAVQDTLALTFSGISAGMYNTG